MNDFMTIDMNWLQMCSSTKHHLFYTPHASQFSAMIIALWHFWPPTVLQE